MSSILLPSIILEFIGHISPTSLFALDAGDLKNPRIHQKIR
jgi:hypothetical protein